MGEEGTTQALSETVKAIIRKRLEDHDKSRIALQSKLDGVCARLSEEIDKAEERVSAELVQAYEKEETRLQEAIQRETNDNSNSNTNVNECYTQKYTILKRDNEREISRMISLKTERINGGGAASIATLQALSERHHKSKTSAAEALAAMCSALRDEVKSLKERINSELEGKYTSEDKRLQDLLGGECDEETARVKLIVEQTYILLEDDSTTKNVFHQVLS